MSADSIFDMMNQQAALTTLPAVKLRFNTAAAIASNTRVAIRCKIPIRFRMNWGDGITEVVTPDQWRLENYNFQGTTDQIYAYDHTYPAPGIYDAALYTIGMHRLFFKTGWKSTWMEGYGVSAFDPLNLITRAEMLPGRRYLSQNGFLGNSPYLVEAVFQPGELPGALGPDLRNAFGRSALTALPELDLSLGNAAAAVYDFNTFMMEAKISDISSLTRANTAAIANFNSAFKGLSNLTAFPAISLEGANGSTNCFDDTWVDCRAMTSFGLCVMPATRPIARLSGTWSRCSGLKSFPLMNFRFVEAFYYTWVECSGLTTFPSINVDSALNCFNTWANCRSLQSFPALDFKRCTNFVNTWGSCTSLTSFPLIPCPAGQNFAVAWSDCSGLTSFPAIQTPAAARFERTWEYCSKLTAFPSLGPLANLTDARRAWADCTALRDFPANFFDNCPCVQFSGTDVTSGAFSNCALTQQSVDNILVSINSNGTSNGQLRMTGGTNATPSTAGLAAVAAMRARGWTIFHN